MLAKILVAFLRIRQIQQTSARPSLSAERLFFTVLCLFEQVSSTLQQLNSTEDLESIYIHITTAMHSTPIFRMNIINRGQTLYLIFPGHLMFFFLHTLSSPGNCFMFTVTFLRPYLCVHCDLFSFFLAQIVTYFTIFFEFSFFTCHFRFGNWIATSASRTYSNIRRCRTFPTNRAKNFTPYKNSPKSANLRIFRLPTLR